ncbi:TerC family protein [Demequina aurantiaca]|uniref:TerC family protein n=1 Tax=Demequina aurantiaca TaxID=676200 RepID=UPI0009FFB481|nr:TerC family protein [Demequina aurantiaca]
MNETIVWTATIGLIVALFAFDFIVVIRRPHVPTFRESVFWSLFYIGLALLFGASMHFWWDDFHAGEYFAGYVTEKSLSVDNLFVFLVIMTRFAVPPKYRPKVLLIGIAIALILRGLFIWAGAAAIEHFSWTFYIFGAFLVYTAIGLVREDSEDAAHPEYKESALIRGVRKIMPVTDGYRGGRMTVREAGKRMITPLLIVVLALGTTDVLFALDSIPAIFGLTKDPYIVFTANAFALLGLRQLFFLVDGLLQRLVYLHYGLAAILAFIGVKLVLEALHSNSVSWLNGGEPFDWAPVISTSTSLIVILATLTIATVASLIATRNKKALDAELEAAEGGEELRHLADGDQSRVTEATSGDGETPDGSKK